jgi:AcrR family transcriptional regulator
MVISVQPRKPLIPAEAGRRERRRQETSERIFMAAMDLFSRHGFSETTVEDITRAADVGKGTFFNYFPSKEHVLGFLVSKQAGVVAQHLALARLGTTSSDRVLISLGRSLVKFPGKSPQMARSLMSAFLGNTEVREYVVRELTEKRQWIAEIISLGQERGELNSELPAADLARVFQHALFGTVLMWALDPSTPLEKQFSNTMQTFLSGLNVSSKARPRALQKVLPKAMGRKQSEAK